MTIPDWLQPYLLPSNITLATLTFCSLIVLIGVGMLVIVLRRQGARSLALEEQLSELQSFLQQQQEISARSAETASTSVDELKKSLHEQTRVLESLRASSNVSEHWDALEKLLVFTEQLDKMSRDINVAFSGVIDEIKSQQSERVRLAQNGFKIQTDQARKVLEKAIIGKLAAAPLPKKDLDQLAAGLVDSIRYSMLTVGKHHQDNLNGFARVLLEDLELKIQNGLRNTFYKIEDLKQKTEQFTQLLGSDWSSRASAEPAPEPITNGELTSPPVPSAVVNVPLPVAPLAQENHTPDEGTAQEEAVVEARPDTNGKVSHDLLAHPENVVSIETAPEPDPANDEAPAPAPTEAEVAATTDPAPDVDHEEVPLAARQVTPSPLPPN